ncbi:MAG: ParB family transcriptional regulator, chromosome partitioning protein [Clostridiales bacterium]|jgi:ParB-like chromosome segregation protein Spo0J|nr:ParB family transcriptional regulator, chromosome partitioning protein [Clostridiales bacterium]
MADNKQPIGPEEHIAPEVAGTDMPGPVPGPELTAEKAVTLEQERRAALHETGEPLPGFGDNVVPFAAAEKPGPEKVDKLEKSAPTKEPEKPKEAVKLRRGRPSKADKTAPAKAMPPKRDKTSQSRKDAEKTASVKEAPLSTEPEQSSVPRDATRSEEPEQIMYLNLSELHAFKNHPFGVRDDAEMRSLVESVKTGGVNQPALVRPRAEGGYEIIAGHRRQKASELAGYANMPCIVRNMTDDEAILAMTDDNLRQRTEILPTEKAQSLKMQVEAIKHQGVVLVGESDQKDIGKRSTEVVGERNNMNYKQVQRYIRLTELVPDLQKMVDEKKLSFTPAVEISFIKPKNQRYIAVSIEGQQSSPSLSQAQKLRELDKESKLNGDVIDGILSQEKKEVDKVIISTAELNKYFGKEKTPREIKDQIIALLDDWKAKQPPELSKPEKKADLEK